MKELKASTQGDKTVATGKMNQKNKGNIIVDDNSKKLNLKTSKKGYIIRANNNKLFINKESGKLSVYPRKENSKPLFTQNLPKAKNGKVNAVLNNKGNSHYYGGGMQNGKFDLTGDVANIENTNDWLDRGVSSPNPFFWSTQGYGVLFNTFGKGKYDFSDSKQITLTHDDHKYDAYYMVDKKPHDIINDYYKLTGKPNMLPTFGYYPAHLNAYNRDAWVQVTKDSSNAIKFEDGKYYKEYQPINPKTFNDHRQDTINIDGKKYVPNVRKTNDVTFIKKGNGDYNYKIESLNGEKDNYQFSGRAVIDRYKKNDMPLGWILPNDGYGAGYGQTNSLDKNIKNLSQFTSYAQKNGVETGLWTQEDLMPKNPKKPKADERNIEKEVKDGHISAVKTDAAWVGNGYKSGLQAMDQIDNAMTKDGNNKRPFAVTLDGWAGTQRVGSLWLGDQTGGSFDNIGYQIPTFIGSSLSGLSNVGADFDGIYEGDKPIVQTRDFQWKSFTPINLNMDGWGAQEKNPFTFGGKYEDINRFYLKLKSQLLPYIYSNSYENYLNGKPLIKPTTYDLPSKFEGYADIDHEFLLGNNLLVAPIYEDNKSDSQGNDKRDGIYLPGKNTTWIDYFTGKEYKGDQIINHFNAPLWKTPLFVKKGAILPQNNANNNVKQIDHSKIRLEFFPQQGTSKFNLYEDDGTTNAYKKGKFSKMIITSETDSNKQLSMTLGKTQGNFAGQRLDKSAILNIHTDKKPKQVKINGKEIPLTPNTNLEETKTSGYKSIGKNTINTFSKNENSIPKLNNGRVIQINTGAIHLKEDNTITIR